MTFATLTRYLLLPLHTAPLLLILVVSGLLSFASRAGVFGLPLALILLSWFFKYSFALLDGVTSGAREPPVLSIEMINPANEHRSLLLLMAVIGLFFLSDASSYWFGPIFGTLLALAVVSILPAIIAVQGATGSLLQSLNLYRCSRLVARLGRDYAVLIAVIAALLAIAILTARTGAVPVFLRSGVALFGWLASFALIGGVLFERRIDIGLADAHEIDVVEVRDATERERARDGVMDRIYAEWRGGSHITACKTITELLASAASPADELEWLYAKAAVWPDQRLANQLAQAWIPYLLDEKRAGRVLEVLKERLASDPNFRPTTSTQLLRCVRLARDGGARKTARGLLVGFADKFPNDTLQPVVDELTSQLEG